MWSVQATANACVAHVYQRIALKFCQALHFMWTKMYSNVILADVAAFDLLCYQTSVHFCAYMHTSWSRPQGKRTSWEARQTLCNHVRLASIVMIMLRCKFPSTDCFPRVLQMAFACRFGLSWSMFRYQVTRSYWTRQEVQVGEGHGTSIFCASAVREACFHEHLGICKFVAWASSPEAAIKIAGRVVRIERPGIKLTDWFEKAKPIHCVRCHQVTTMSMRLRQMVLGLYLSMRWGWGRARRGGLSSRVSLHWLVTPNVGHDHYHKTTGYHLRICYEVFIILGSFLEAGHLCIPAMQFKQN